MYTVFSACFPILVNTVQCALAETSECLGNAFPKGTPYPKVAQPLECANMCNGSPSRKFSLQTSQTFKT